MNVNTAPSDGETLQLWVGTKTFIPMLKVDETPGFTAIDTGLSVVTQDNDVMAADLSALRLPATLPCGGSYLVAIIIDSVSRLCHSREPYSHFIKSLFQNGEAVDFDSQSIYVNCDGDSAGIDFGLELVGIDLNDDASLTRLRNTLRNTVLQPGENPFEALGISGVR